MYNGFMPCLFRKISSLSSSFFLPHFSTWCPLLPHGSTQSPEDRYMLKLTHLYAHRKTCCPTGSARCKQPDTGKPRSMLPPEPRLWLLGNMTRAPWMRTKKLSPQKHVRKYVANHPLKVRGKQCSVKLTRQSLDAPVILSPPVLS